MKRMKRWTALLLVLCLLVIPPPAQATDESNLVFELNSDGESYCVVDCNDSASGSLEIPASFNGRPVTEIGFEAFYDCDDLTIITIPDSVTSIGSGAFSSCNALESVYIGKGVTKIRNFAFESCWDLTGIWVDENNTVYSSDGSGSLLNKEKTELLQVPCGTSGSYHIHNGVTTVAYYAFDGSYNIENITIPSSVTSISANTLTSCFGLTGIWVDENNPNYSNDSYGVLFNKDKSSLIYAHRGLEDGYIIPESVTKLGDRAFYNCYGLVDIKLSEKITEIGEEAFAVCSGLNGIWVDENNPNYSSDGNGVLFNKDKSVLITATVGIGDCYVVPDSVITIKSDAFYSYENLTSITIPVSVTMIDSYAFYDCSGLTDVYYYGTELQREQIRVERGNGSLDDVKWHYDVTAVVLGSQTVYQCSCCNQYQYAVSKENVFADISNTSWQTQFAIYAYQKGLMAGKGTDANGKIKFDPNNSITRAEFVQVLYNAESKPSVSIANKFPDVKNEWYKNAVLWANSQNIANGMGDGNFGVGKNITRQDLALMLYKYAKLKDADLTATAGKSGQYADGSKVSGYAQQAMDWAVTQGVMSGKGASGAPASQLRLDPAGTATRAECAAMLKNYMEAQDGPDTPDAPAMTAILSGVEADSIQYYKCAESGNFAVIEKNGKYGIIGYDGEIIVPITHSKIRKGFGFSYNLLIIEEEDRYIDKNGQLWEGCYGGGGIQPSAYWYNDSLVILNFSSRDIMTLEEYLDSPYSEGLEMSGLVIDRRKWNSNKIFPARKMTGYTNSGYWQEPIYNKVEIALMDMDTYELISDFVYEAFDEHNGVSEGLLAVKKDSKWGFVNEEGAVVIDFLYEPYESYVSYGKTYEYAYTAVNGYIAVKKDGKWGLLDTRGNTVLEPVYDGVSQVNPDGMFWLEENGSWTLYQLEV